MQDEELNLKKPWMEAFVEFLADPFTTQTAKSFAEEWNISEQALYKWKSRHKVPLAEAVERARKLYISDVRSSAWKNVTKQMDKGDTAAIKLVFQLTGDLVERTENNVNYMSEADKKERIKALAAKLGKRIEAGGTKPQAEPEQAA